MILRPLDERDLPALLALQGHGSLGELRADLYDAGRGFGRNVVVAEQGGVVVGATGWVEAPPTCYGAPTIAPEEDVAAALIEHVRARAEACGATVVRISARDREPGKRAALLAAGFAPVFDFLTLARRGRAGRLWDRGARIACAEIDVARLRELFNDTFAGVPNAEPLEAAEVARLLVAERTAAPATAVYGDHDGFIHVEHDVDEDGPYAIIAAIGVRAALRGRGVAGAILDDALARIAEDECRALIASTNAASLALHASRGFVEKTRRTVFELTRG